MKKIGAHKCQEARNGSMRGEKGALREDKENAYGMSMEEEFCGRKVTVETGYNQIGRYGSRITKYI